MIPYKDLQFPKNNHQPYFFSNFVTTVDGKAVVKGSNIYEPIGTENDFATFIDLRTYADALIHGKTTASLHRTIETKEKDEFVAKRKERGKDPILAYYILTNSPDDSLLPALENNPGELPFLVTNKHALIPPSLVQLATVLRFGAKTVDLQAFTTYLSSKGQTTVLVEGGPTLLGSFLKHDLLDEVFLTLAPKIFGGKDNKTLTMVEGNLFSPEKVKQLELLEVHKMENEVFLRYKIVRT